MSRRVIIADDSALARMFLRRCLEISGLSEAEFVEVGDGLEALEVLKKDRIDLVVTDLTMPNMTGLELVRSIDSNPDIDALPILVVTSSGNEEQRKELLDLGASAILSKPISPPVVSEALAKIFPDIED